jgi:hypothetical protein
MRLTGENISEESRVGCGAQSFGSPGDWLTFCFTPGRGER